MNGNDGRSGAPRVGDKSDFKIATFAGFQSRPTVVRQVKLAATGTRDFNPPDGHRSSSEVGKGDALRRAGCPHFLLAK